MSLFTNQHLEDIFDRINNNHVTVLMAPTGIGKSTYVPKYLFEKHGLKSIIVQPTIPAAKWLYKRQSLLMGQQNVGWSADTEVHYQNKLLLGSQFDTNVVYCTGGHMHRRMLDIVNRSAGNLNEFDMVFTDVLILDELHIGSLDYEVIMGLYRYALERGANLPRLLLSSATIDLRTLPFTQYGEYIVEIKGYDIIIEYHDKNYKPSDRQIYKDVTQVILKKHYANVPGAKGSAWLVFCPGKAEIELTANEIIANKNPSDDSIIITPLYSDLNEEDQNLVNSAVPSGKRRIIISTNIAEASITIDDLSGVFDTMTEKVSEESSTGGQRLVVKSISKSSAKQRMGRTGRTISGFCYKMCTQEFFDKLRDSKPREIQLIPIHNVVLELFDIKVHPRNVFSKVILTDARLQSSISLLQRLELIRSDFTVTESGKFVPKFVYSVRAGVALWHWKQANYPLFPGILAISLIDSYGPPYFHYPYKKVGQNNHEYRNLLQETYNEHFKRYDANTYIEILLNMFQAMLGIYKTYDIPRSERVKYCNENHLNHKKISEASKNIKTTVNILLGSGINIEVGLSNPSNVVKALNPILIISYPDKIVTPSKQPGVYLTENNVPYIIDIVQISERKYTPKDGKLIALSVQEREGIRGARSYMSLFQPIESEKVIEKEEELMTIEDMHPINEAIAYEYNRYLLSLKLIQLLGGNGEKTKVAIRKILEYALITAYNIIAASKETPKFALFTGEVATKIIQTLNELRIPYDPNIINIMNLAVQEYENLPRDVLHNMNVSDNQITFREYVSDNPRINQFIMMTNPQDTLRMLLRYDSLVPGGQQWPTPQKVAKFLYDNGFRYEGFASPLNSINFGMPDWKFCSLFYDTDSPFGSLGPFLSISNPTGNWTIAPPNIEWLPDLMLSKISTSFDLNKSLIHFVLPLWKDTSLYKTLSKYPGTRMLIDYNVAGQGWGVITKAIIALVGPPVSPEFINQLKAQWGA